MRKFKTTAEIPVPEKLIDQVIGQEDAVALIKKAARQRRHVLMLGSPGTGKSMLAQAMAELMPAADLEDVLVYPNPNDENRPSVRVVRTNPSKEDIRRDPQLQLLYRTLETAQRMLPSAPQKQPQKEEMGQGRRIIEQGKMRSQLQSRGISPTLIFLLLLMGAIVLIYSTNSLEGDNRWFVLAIIFGMAFFALMWRFTSQLGRRMGMMMGGDYSDPKLIVDNSGMQNAPFVDGTGSKAGALLGDVKHDPLQSGGLGTPAHLRVESGAIHRANKGVLFIDEMASLRPRAQQELLTAMQEKKYSITGQSEMSSGAIVKTAPVPCDFVLVASGNVVDIRGMHPALRSRIRGAGYEVFVQDSMPDTPQNEERLVQFVAQEVKKDAKIPHFTYDAVVEIIHEARRKAGRKKRLTLNLRELGGLVRAAGDIAIDEGAQLITEGHVGRARSVAASLEQQMSRRSIEYRKDYQMFLSEGYAVGKVNGLAVLGDGSSGLVLPIVAEVTPASSKSEGKLIATGKLGTIAKEAVENVSAIVKKHIGKDVSLYDIHVQFLQTYEGVEGDSASISIAIAVLSAMEGIGVDESYSITGSLSVRGEVLPVGGVTAKTEAAIDAGIKNIIVPKPNLEDIYLSDEMKRKIKIHPVSNLVDVVDLIFRDSEKKEKIIRKMRGMLNGKK